MTLGFASCAINRTSLTLGVRCSIPQIAAKLFHLGHGVFAKPSVRLLEPNHPLTEASRLSTRISLRPNFARLFA